MKEITTPKGKTLALAIIRLVNVILATAFLWLITATTHAQTLPQAVHGRSPHPTRAVVVHIKNGPVIRGRLVQADKDSISLEIENASCPITLDIEDVTRIIFPEAEMAQKALRKAYQVTTSPQTREAPTSLREVGSASVQSIGDREGDTRCH